MCYILLDQHLIWFLLFHEIQTRKSYTKLKTLMVKCRQTCAQLRNCGYLYLHHDASCIVTRNVLGVSCGKCCRESFTKLRPLSGLRASWRRVPAWVVGWGDGHQWPGIRFHLPPNWRWGRRHREWWTSKILWTRCRYPPVWVQLVSGCHFQTLWSHRQTRNYFNISGEN